MGSIGQNEALPADNQATVALKVGVIGAGIAGLAAAITLKDAGHDVEVS